jgi:lipoyl(octanoyl) transferase
LGTGSSLEHVRFDLNNSPAPLHRTERGGEVTYHCPGQLVGYPILNLHRYRLDLHWYLRQLEEVLLRVVGGYGLTGQRIAGLTGVWVQGVKVAAIGIKVKKWVTMHGFALNVCPDLSGFEQIVPCGLRDRAVGRLVDFVPGLTLPQVERDLIVQFGQVFGCHMEIQR